jgi:hypothetical protein
MYCCEGLVYHVSLEQDRTCLLISPHVYCLESLQCFLPSFLSLDVTFLITGNPNSR